MLRQEIWRSQWPTDQPKDTTARRPSQLQNQRPGLSWSSQPAEFLATFGICCVSQARRQPAMEDPLARTTVTERYYETHEILTTSALSLYTIRYYTGIYGID